VSRTENFPPGNREPRDGRSHGWFVRVGYRRTKQGWRPKHRAFFGDKSHGGKTAALKAAEQWLNSVKE
jgi:hypothetical protein